VGRTQKRLRKRGVSKLESRRDRGIKKRESHRGGNLLVWARKEKDHKRVTLKGWEGPHKVSGNGGEKKGRPERKERLRMQKGKKHG